MEVNVVKDYKQPLLSRREVIAEITFSGATPSRKEIKKQMAEFLKEKEDLAVVVAVKTAFGHQKASVQINFYESKEAMDRLAPKHLVQRGLPKVEKDGQEKN
ncbi:MAG: hypothetical protein ABIG95_03715 [Candidatus Woesearchaeota archaeon]